MKPPIREYDVVRVARLADGTRQFEGTEGRRRHPEIGDLGTVVFEYGDRSGSSPVAVESVDKEGFTIWLADFSRDELELVSRQPKEEPNQPLQRNASTGSVSNFESPARRG